MTSTPDSEPTGKSTEDTSTERRDIVWPRDPARRKRAIELELTRIRKEASVARLEARAAELETMLREINDDLTSDGTIDGRVRFTSWVDVRQAQLTADTASSRIDHQDGIRRTDAAHTPLRRPSFLSGKPESPAEVNQPIAGLDVGDSPQAVEDFPFPVFEPECEPNHGSPEPLGSDLSSANFAVVEDESHEQERSEHKRPLAVVASVALHVCLLICLGWFSLQVSNPKDQIAFTGSPSAAADIPVESMSIETTEIDVQPDTSTTDVEYEFSPVGEMVAAKFSPNLSVAPASPALNTGMLNQASAAAMSLSASTSEAKIEFCGIKGGGNHFVYLVDSSGSMGDAFASARLELLRSIDLLKPDQRFYVVFFDEEPDYMRLTNPNVDEPASMMATPTNKEKLRQWAMRITMNRGRAPYDPIEFALGLRPDVIFLLSDGEFPERLVEKLDEANRIENLFGDVKPISIIHTIGYHSREGEARMKIIAKKNGGQYRHVPDPTARR